VLELILTLELNLTITY